MISLRLLYEVAVRSGRRGEVMTVHYPGIPELLVLWFN